jgi:hypothetical protein
MGATLDNPKVGFEITKYAAQVQERRRPGQGRGAIVGVIPKLDVEVNELSAAKIAHAMPGATQVVGTAAETGGGADTTLAADAAIGATNIKVTAVTGMSVGDYLRIGDAGETEIHKITVVGTTGSGGTGVTLDAALIRDHDTGDQLREVDDAGTSLFTWTIGTIPDASYVDVEAIGVGADGRQLRVKIKNALAGDSFSFDMGDDAFYGIPLTFSGNYGKATPTRRAVRARGRLTRWPRPPRTRPPGARTRSSLRAAPPSPSVSAGSTSGSGSCRPGRPTSGSASSRPRSRACCPARGSTASTGLASCSRASATPRSR